MPAKDQQPVSTESDGPTITLKAPQAAVVRRLVFKDLHEHARKLVEQTEWGSDWTPSMGGDDAQTTIKTLMGPLIDVLDAVGWSTHGDGDDLIASERLAQARLKLIC